MCRKREREREGEGERERERGGDKDWKVESWKNMLLERELRSHVRSHVRTPGLL